MTANQPDYLTTPDIAKNRRLGGLTWFFRKHRALAPKYPGR
jgi:hypothetical protein